MKITKQYLKQVIKEELARAINENDWQKSVMPIKIDKKEALLLLRQLPEFEKNVVNNPFYSSNYQSYDYGLALDKAATSPSEPPQYAIARRLDNGTWSAIVNNVPIKVHVASHMTGRQ